MKMSKYLVAIVAFLTIFVGNVAIISCHQASRISITPFDSLRIGLKIVSGNNQGGIVGRSAEKPLVVKAYNLDNPKKSLEGIPLSFEIIKGGGIFFEAKGYSTVTNHEGKAGLEYHYTSTPGINKVKVGVLGDSSVIPVEFDHLEGYLPQLKINPLIKSGNLIKIKAIDPKRNIGIEDTYVKIKFIGHKEAIISPAELMTDEKGERICGITTIDGTISGTIEAYLPGFVDPTINEWVSDRINIRSLPNKYLQISSGNTQIGVNNFTLVNPLTVYVKRQDTTGKYQQSKVIFKVLHGKGLVDNKKKVKKWTSTTTGKASVTYTFGPKRSPQVIEVRDVGSGEKTYFVLGYAEPIKFVKWSNPSIFQGGIFSVKSLENLDNLPEFSKFVVEVKMPSGFPGPVTATIRSGDQNGKPLTRVRGAIAPIKIENFLLTKVSNNERFSIWRSDMNKPFVAFNYTISPNESLPELPEDITPIQIISNGTLIPSRITSLEEDKGTKWEK